MGKKTSPNNPFGFIGFIGSRHARDRSINVPSPGGITNKGLAAWRIGENRSW